MPNPLFNALGGNRLPAPMGQFQQMMQQFQQFRQNFQGDPKQEVQKLLQSGKMSQQQLNQLQAMAQQFQGFLK
ncbi:hypothetical protein [uncultured Gemmiger sp.]|jgi:hypothetical protein|uniref:hypothetical protein n=1 Tax=uncultured Gemmiger sp. TaxID=1623490 RepID=UPI00205D3771|nr:hypothetical protein [uncultured Gemmiger sp.]DAU97141.1 MAG TPA: hypothetical protein [Caudoviricetes sp.]